MFYEGLKGLHKTFWGTTKKYENKNLIFVSIQLSEMHRTGRINMEKSDVCVIIRFVESDFMKVRPVQTFRLIWWDLNQSN